MNFLSDPNVLTAGVLLALVQFLAALPWLRTLDPTGFASLRNAVSWGTAVIIVVLGGLMIAGYISYKGDSVNLRFDGRVFGSVLHLQLLIDLFILAPRALLLISPKAGAVALAAYREGWRQPMFWLIAVVALLFMAISIAVPYFTFGEDYKMMKQIGFDIIMLSAALFGVLASSIAIAEEIEGRTAITVMSKPINRRNFLFGKFLGILMACGAMSLILAWCLNWALIANVEFDKINEQTDALAIQAKADLLEVFDAPPAETAAVPRKFLPRVVGQAVAAGFKPGTPGNTFAKGTGEWFAENVAHGIGVLLGFGQVMILVAISCALATRLPFAINILISMVVYFLGHLAPVVVKVSEKMSAEGSSGVGLVRFLGQLFDTVLPALDFFNMGPAIIRDVPLDLWAFATHVIVIFGYACLYTAIALIVGLLLFEDRDLA